MIYVERDSQAKVKGLYRCLQAGYAEEMLPDDHPEVIAFLAAKLAVDGSDIDNLERTLKAMVLLIRQYANQLKAGTYVTKAIADTRADFATIYRALP